MFDYPSTPVNRAKWPVQSNGPVGLLLQLHLIAHVNVLRDVLSVPLSPSIHLWRDSALLSSIDVTVLNEWMFEFPHLKTEERKEREGERGRELITGTYCCRTVVLVTVLCVTACAFVLQPFYISVTTEFPQKHTHRHTQAQTVDVIRFGWETTP